MRFTTIGAAIVDIVVSRVRPMLGAKQDVDHIGLYAGGGAVNAALNVAAQGADVTLHACVGQDLEGGLVRDLLQRHGIRAMIPGHALPTGKSVVMVDDSGAARAYAQRGASAWVGEQGFTDLGQSDVIYVTGLSLKSQDWLGRALSTLPSSGFRLVVTPGARQLSHPQALHGLWDRADLLCVNAVEAARLCDQELSDADAVSPQTAESLARRLVRTPGQCVLVTLGAAGAVFYDGGQAHFHAARPVSVVSTIGAGDAFASAFAYAWASGTAPQSALAAATDSAARVVQVIPANLAGPLRPFHNNL
ncbi:MAG: carbohydrate kinase family protein [Castellaniella sp.]|uniref:carbohydrate kinase family protein n=1 Tax=Castellaniella sp. TaxID=1955812 RepID=UPI001216CB4F|nr:carbohydrate kinase family protein [Castellaniella sp.]TAN26621.1 MAG: carbohydrate kinase family protein [Castellaniella sp.]